MPLEIRNLQTDELASFIDVKSTAFLDRPAVDKIAERVESLWDLHRTWGAFDDNRLCGTFRSWATELTVPGGAQLPAAAITNVGVLPTHRRRGVLRAMVAAEHAAIRDRGEALGLLYSAEYPIYGRFGYGPSCQQATWTLDALATQFRGRSTDRVELVQPDATVRDAISGVFEAWRLRQPGEIRRQEQSWDIDLGLRESEWGPRWNGFLALHRDAAGIVDGYVRYGGEEKWERGQPRAMVTVYDLHALTLEAYAGLWRFLAETDLVSVVKAENRSPGERLPWLLTNARAADVSSVLDGMWTRLIDIPRALGARTYDREDDLVLEVIDVDAPNGSVRLALEAGPEGATCRTSHRSADLTLDVAALGAAFLGGTALRNAVLATGVDEHRPGALARADALFGRSEEPWCSTFF